MLIAGRAKSPAGVLAVLFAMLFVFLPLLALAAVSSINLLVALTSGFSSIVIFSTGFCLFLASYRMQ